MFKLRLVTINNFMHLNKKHYESYEQSIVKINETLFVIFFIFKCYVSEVINHKVIVIKS